MFKHFIFLLSSYYDGKRLALRYVYSGGVDKNEIRSVLDVIESIDEGSLAYSTHFICTESAGWESVVSYDPYFEDVHLVDSKEEFFEYMKKDLKITGLDISMYILSKRSCTHLALEKLLYLCYADYLCKYEKLLFEDKIYAFKLGPVVKSVYDKYSRHRDTLSSDITEVVARSRILLLPDGFERLQSIDATLEKYANCSASDLVDITHAKGSPWSMKDSTKSYQGIEDDLILRRHSVEEKYFAERIE